jgi:hypothetical protein
MNSCHVAISDSFYKLASTFSSRAVASPYPPKLSRQQIDHAQKLIDGGRREDAATLPNVDWTALYREPAG